MVSVQTLRRFRLSLIYLSPKTWARWDVCSAWSTSWESLSPISPQWLILSVLYSRIKQHGCGDQRKTVRSPNSKHCSRVTKLSNCTTHLCVLRSRLTAHSTDLVPLSQKSEDGTWHPVAYASKTLSSTEKRYAQVEKEALASACACIRFEDHLIGLKFILETDHKPLVALLGTKSLDELPACIQWMRMRLMRFSYVVVHIPGKQLYTADTLCRAPGKMYSSYSKFHDEIDAFVNLVLDHGWFV